MKAALPIAVILLVSPTAMAELLLPEMVQLGPGTFEMGRTTGDPDETPVVPITLQHEFWIAKTEVTVAQYRQFVDATGYQSSTGCNYYVGGRITRDETVHWTSVPFHQTEQHPVVCVSWADANAYSVWLSGQTSEHYRLPSEAEWAFAAGLSSEEEVPWDSLQSACVYLNGNDAAAEARIPDQPMAHMNASLYGDGDLPFFPCRDGYGATAPVAQFPANQFGLYDMLGNVWEWVADCYSERLDAVPKDGSANQIYPCDRSVMRGSAWNAGPRFARLGNRSSLNRLHGNWAVGFRLVKGGER